MEDCSLAESIFDSNGNERWCFLFVFTDNVLSLFYDNNNTVH